METPLPCGTVTFLFTDIESSTELVRLLQEPWMLEGEPLPVRIALHSGRVADRTGRTFGSVAMNCISLCASAAPGQILVSHATEALLEGDRHDLDNRDLGERTLPTRERAARVFEVAG